jgi:hypothetical protein
MDFTRGTRLPLVTYIGDGDDITEVPLRCTARGCKETRTHRGGLCAFHFTQARPMVETLTRSLKTKAFGWRATEQGQRAPYEVHRARCQALGLGR